MALIKRIEEKLPKFDRIFRKSCLS